MRIACCFDQTIRPETTGVYCRRALETMAEVVELTPGELGRHPGPFDLYLFVDDGLDYPLPEETRPSAYWAIDTHLDFSRSLERARAVDHVFAAQRDGAQRLRDQGVAAQWLPLACAPAIHRVGPMAKRWDIAFVGNVVGRQRQAYLALILERYASVFVGNAYFEEMAQVYAQARIVFNASVAGDLNMRVFEAMASGSLLLTDRVAGLDNLFQEGTHLAAYSSAEELVERIDRFLTDEAARERIAAAGQAEVLARHTYEARMRQILETVECQGARAPLASLAPLAPRSAARTEGKDPGYFDFARPELLARIPVHAQSVLDIGCGSGALGASVKQRQGARVVGIELDPRAAARASQRLDQVIQADIERDEIALADHSFDVIVCGDVLEHLRDPAGLLRRARGWLADNGVLLASLPNVAHHSVVASLLAGNWTYESAGLLDADHVRFFTRHQIEKLLARADYQASAIERQFLAGDEGLLASAASGRLAVPGLELEGLTPENAADLATYQFLVTAQARRPVAGLTSIIIATRDQLEWTKRAVESLRRVVSVPWELIVVDNGSRDGTPAYVHGLSDALLIANEHNRGFAAAMNQGIAAARGEQILLLNNDTLMTTGALERMLERLGSEESIGLVGPMTNRCPVDWPQFLDRAVEPEEADDFAWDWGKTHDGQSEAAWVLAGFCLLGKRSCFERVGPFDERFGIGTFEDIDYCVRAGRQGFGIVVARDAFVYHEGSQTISRLGLDVPALMSRNSALLHAKWRNEPIRFDRAPAVVRPAASGGSSGSPAGAEKVFRHSGDLGDVIYSLPAVRELGGGRLLLDPYREFPWKNPLGRPNAESLARLLSRQAYVTGAGVYAGGQVDHDLDRFRAMGEGLTKEHLALSHWRAMGLAPDAFDGSKPWLAVPPLRRAEIVACRAGRRPGQLAWELLRPHAERAIFLGLPHEHEAFEREFGLGIRHLPVADFEELARVIAGARLVVSDQTFGFALAEGLKVPRVLEVHSETPNCLPLSDNGHIELTQEVLRRYLGGRRRGRDKTQPVRAGERT